MVRLLGDFQTTPKPEFFALSEVRIKKEKTEVRIANSVVEISSNDKRTHLDQTKETRETKSRTIRNNVAATTMIRPHGSLLTAWA